MPLITHLSLQVVMKKKIEIISLVILILLATTGIPLSYHQCNMMQEKSLSECEMCSSTLNEEFTSCCTPDDNQNLISISSDKSACCQNEFGYNKVEDNFVSNKTEANIYFSFENLFQQISLIQPVNDFQTRNSFYSDSSPPFLDNKDIYITNLTLLI